MADQYNGYPDEYDDVEHYHKNHRDEERTKKCSLVREKAAVWREQYNRKMMVTHALEGGS